MGDRGQATEPPSERRLAEARKKGDVFYSADWVASVSFAGTLIVIGCFGSWIIDGVVRYMSSVFSRAAHGRVGPTEHDLYTALTQGVMAWMRVSLLVCGVAALFALLAAWLHVGSLFSLTTIKPDLKRLNPFEKLKSIFGAQGGYTLVKTAIKLVGAMAAIAFVMMPFSTVIPELTQHDASMALTILGTMLEKTAWPIGFLALVLSGGDLLYQRYRYRRKLRMTREEVRREHKENEGDPHHKAERKRVHRELVAEQMLFNVSTAHCVVINPLHVSVAMRYDASTMSAPKIVAKGEHVMAAKIRELAKEHGIPIVRNVPLARALVDLELDEEIPRELYEAVAEIFHTLSTMKR